MGRYADGEVAAFDEIYRRVAPKLLGYLMRLTRDRQAAEDLLQTTFVKVHRARDTYVRGGPFLAWIFAIARRSFLDQKRLSRNQREAVSDDGSLPDRGGSGGMESFEVADALEHALGTIPEKYRDAVLLTRHSGMSMADAAEALGTTVAAVKLRAHRGSRMLRDVLTVAA